MKQSDRGAGPRAIIVRGARVHNLRRIDVDVPLGAFTALTGVSGSGKSSLAMDVLYAEGSRRYLEALSTYTRRRLRQMPRPEVDRIDYCPAALALSQRPPVPGPRSTVGTMTQGLAIVRLMFSRLGVHLCPNGHAVPPSYRNAISPERICPVCGIHFEGPSAEDFSFNGAGACPACNGLGIRREIDPSRIVPDPDRTLAGGAVAPWRGLMRSNMPLVAADLGVRIDVPWKDLTGHERNIVLHGPKTLRKVTVPTRSRRAVTMNIEYLNAYDAAEQMANEGSGVRGGHFFTEHLCEICHGSRYSAKALQSTLMGLDIAAMTALEADAMRARLDEVTKTLPTDTQPLAQALADEADHVLKPLLALGLGYLSLTRSGNTLSTGERQRIGLARIATSNSTGLLLILDEPTVGLQPDDVAGLIALFHGLVADGNTLVVVDHDVQVLRAADHLIELGPGAGSKGGRIVATGVPRSVADAPGTVIGPFLKARAPLRIRPVRPADLERALTIEVKAYLNIDDVTAQFPRGAICVVTGASGAGKSALVIDTLVPALEARFHHQTLPPQVARLDAGGLRRVLTVDATPLGRNARSTIVTYSGIFDPIRRLYAATSAASERGWGIASFSYNTKEGQCPACLGIGQLSLDLQYLPDLTMRCPTCEGRRYKAEVEAVTWNGRSITQLLALTVCEAIEFFDKQPAIQAVLQAIEDVGLGYVLLGEATPALSGGEAQRLRLAQPIRASQAGAVFVFDEPTIGLHPRDVQVLLGVMDRLIAQGATIIAVDHDLDLIANADWVIEMGPGSGAQGGQIIAAGPPDAIAHDPRSRIGPWLNGARETGSAVAFRS